ncbi:MAG: hypothetical protein ACLPT4_09710 [Verrucomicrobiia bacterium]
MTRLPTRILVLAVIWLMIGDARRALIPHYKMDSLAYLSSDVVLAQERGSTPKQTTARVETNYIYDDFPTALHECKGDQIVDAPAEDFELANTYHEFKDKGALVKGQRITILTKKTRYKVGEPVRVLHVLQSVQAGINVYVMGPKLIYDEYVDGKLASAPMPTRAAYRGVVVNDRPMADFNYDITTYTFSEPGEHTIQWKGGGHPVQHGLGLESNVIKLSVVKE